MTRTDFSNLEWLEQRTHIYNNSEVVSFTASIGEESITKLIHRTNDNPPVAVKYFFRGKIYYFIRKILDDINNGN